MAGNLKTVVVNVGAFSATTSVPVMYFPATYGGITVVSAYLAAPGAGTIISAALTSLGTAPTAGTPTVSGTIASTSGTLVQAAGQVNAMTLSTVFVDPDTTPWLGLKVASGTMAGETQLIINYLEGK